MIEDECLIWTGKIGSHGYGLHGHHRKAHRTAWEKHFGPIPKGKCVLHKCDVRACVNPAHLFIGTRADNMRDMYSKGREVPLTGERNGRSKLTEAEVVAIRYQGKRGNYSRLAREYGVSNQLISRICNGGAWKHL